MFSVGASSKGGNTVFVFSSLLLSLCKDIINIIQQQNEETRNNVKHLRADLDDRMDNIFDEQQTALDKRLSVIMRQPHTPPGIEPPPRKRREVETTSTEFQLTNNNESNNEESTNILLPPLLDVPMENNLPPDPNKTQQE